MWWLSGIVLDTRSNGSGLESHWRQCIESLSKTLDLEIVDWDVKQQNISSKIEFFAVDRESSYFSILPVVWQFLRTFFMWRMCCTHNQGPVNAQA